LVLNALLCNLLSQNPIMIYDYWLSFITPIMESFFLKEVEIDIIDDMIIQAREGGLLPNFRGHLLQRIHNASSLLPQNYYRRGPGFLRIVNNPDAIWRERHSFVPDTNKSDFHTWIKTLRRLLPPIDKTKPKWQNPDIKKDIIKGLLPDWHCFREHTDNTTLSILLPFIVSITDKAGEHYYVDFQRGLAVISEIIKSTFQQDRKVRDIIKKELNKWCTSSTYGDTSEDIIKTYSVNISDNVIAALKDWIEDFPIQKITRYPIETLINIWDSTLEHFKSFYTLVEFPDDLSVGWLLNECVISFLHSILLEEIRLRQHNSLQEIGSYKERHPEFAQLKALLTEKINLSFFQFWLNCPFINALLTNSQVRELEQIDQLNFKPFTYTWEWTLSDSLSRTPLKDHQASSAYNILCALMPVKRPSETELPENEIDERADRLWDYLFTQTTI
jgi:hypothetical protein